MKPFNYLKIFSIFLLLFCISSSLLAQNKKFDELVEKGIDQIYNIEFHQAETTFRKLIADYPNHPAGRFMIAMIYWWKILLEPEEDRYDETFLKKLENVIEFCDDLLDKNSENVDALFFKGGAIGFRGRLNVLRENWLSAADDGREALPIVEEAGSLDPNNKDVLLGYGIYNYFASVIPENYPIVKPLMIFFPSGDKELGINQLKDSATNGKYTKHEARFFLMNLYYNFESDYEMAEYYGDILTESFPNNPVFERWRGRVSVKRGDWFTADSIFKSVLGKAEKNFTGYNTLKVKREAEYYVAYQFKNLNDWEKSFQHFNRCIDYSKQISEEKESGFLINATLFAGTALEMQGKYDEAKKYYNKVLGMKDFNNSIGMAKNYLTRIENLSNQKKN